MNIFKFFVKCFERKVKNIHEYIDFRYRKLSK